MYYRRCFDDIFSSIGWCHHWQCARKGHEEIWGTKLRNGSLLLFHRAGLSWYCLGSQWSTYSLHTALIWSEPLFPFFLIFFIWVLKIKFCLQYPLEVYGYGFLFSLTGYLGVNLVLTLVRTAGAFAAVTVILILISIIYNILNVNY